MSTRIYWFSATGNSYWTAKKIQEGIEGSSLSNISHFDMAQLTGTDTIGLVFPVYAWGPPKIVKEFIKKLTAKSGTYIFIVMTYAKFCGRTARFVDRTLARNGLSLSASFGVRMQNNYPPLYKKQDFGKIERTKEEALESIGTILDSIKRKIRGNFEKKSQLRSLLAIIAYPVFIGLSNRMASFFHADDICNRCGLCAEICPTKNIVLTETGIVWKHNCEQCFACYHWCPKMAIQFGNITESQLRYHFPGVTLPEMGLNKRIAVKNDA
jgi:ferredoxin